MTLSDWSAIGLMILLPVISLFFWIRGLIRTSIGDIVAGLGILLATCTAILLIMDSSAAFNNVGGILIVYGVSTYVASRFVKDTPLFKRRELILSAALFVVVGLCGLVII